MVGISWWLSRVLSDGVSLFFYQFDGALKQYAADSVSAILSRYQFGSHKNG